MLGNVIISRGVVELDKSCVLKEIHFCHDSWLFLTVSGLLSRQQDMVIDCCYQERLIISTQVVTVTDDYKHMNNLYPCPADKVANEVEVPL